MVPRQSSLVCEAGFDFTRAMRRLCNDLVSRLDELRHIDMERVLVSYSQARSRSLHGLQASLMPLRFEGGRTYEVRHGQRWEIERIYDEQGREFLYILTFYLPRFLNHSFQEKLTTVVHELWHISPQFNGDLRRHEGTCYIHGPSQKAYDTAMEALARRWLSLDPPRETHAFLHSSFSELRARHGAVFGLRVRRPKLVRVPPNPA